MLDTRGRNTFPLILSSLSVNISGRYIHCHKHSLILKIQYLWFYIAPWSSINLHNYIHVHTSIFFFYHNKRIIVNSATSCDWSWSCWYCLRLIYFTDSLSIRSEALYSCVRCKKLYYGLKSRSFFITGGLHVYMLNNACLQLNKYTFDDIQHL